MYSVDQILPTTLAPPPRLRLAAEPSDAVLIERSLRDPQAFGALFDRHWAAIHAYCTSRAAAAGEDIAAEVFRVAFDQRRRFDRRRQPAGPEATATAATPGDAAPWLYGIATNLLRHHFRSGQRRDRAGRRVKALAELDAVPQPLEQLEAQLLGPRLTAALKALPEIDREALLLFAWAELGYQEIAVALDIPVGTVRSRIHRARARVREHVVLSSQGETEND